MCVCKLLVKKGNGKSHQGGCSSARHPVLQGCKLELRRDIADKLDEECLGDERLPGWRSEGEREGVDQRAIKGKREGRGYER